MISFFCFVFFVFWKTFIIFTHVQVKPVYKSKIRFLIISNKRSKIQTNQNVPTSLSLISENVFKTQRTKKTAEQNVTMCYEVC